MYEEIQREKEGEDTGKIKQSVEYRYSHTKGIFSPPIPEEKVAEVSNKHIECLQGVLDVRAVFDYPMPTGWLYSGYANTTDFYKRYFDTQFSEYWVLPNFFCDLNNVLGAVSWMRSNTKSAYNNNKGMHIKFKDHSHSFYDGADFADSKTRKGVYCGWIGWLYNPSGAKLHYRYWIDTTSDDELFTLLNVHCRLNRVRFLWKEEAHHGQSEGANEHPFRYRPSRYKFFDIDDHPFVHCNWSGWLYS